MVSFTSVGVVLTSALSVLALPHSQPEEQVNSLFARQSPSSSGYHDNWYYNFWSDAQGPHNYTNLPGGRYNVSWGSPGNFVGGKGWEVGKPDRIVRYSGTFAPSGNAYVSVYGWMKNPLIEYYIVDNHGSYNPGSGAKYMGSVTTDGSTYGIYSGIRVGQGLGIPTYLIYWSVRYQPRTGGAITIKNHFDAWQSLGMHIGTVQDYQILAVEGYYSSGKADITVYRDI